MKFNDLAAVWSDLKPGDEVPIDDARCVACDSEDVVLAIRLKTNPRASLAGAQPKVAAMRWPWTVCKGCGAESEGSLG